MKPFFLQGTDNNLALIYYLQKIQHLEQIVHEECMERTYLLDSLNEFRSKEQLPLLEMKEVREAAKEHTATALQERPSKENQYEGCQSEQTKLPPISREPSATRNKDSLWGSRPRKLGSNRGRHNTHR